MKTAVAIMMTLVVATFFGCTSHRGGGMSGGEGFNIGTPTFDTKIKQGETASVTISLNRGEYFKRDVKLEIRASAKGVSVEPTQALVKGSEKGDVQLRITAAKDANLGAYTIFVQGTPAAGESTTTEIQVKVVSP